VWQFPGKARSQAAIQHRVDKRVSIGVGMRNGAGRVLTLSWRCTAGTHIVSRFSRCCEQGTARSPSRTAAELAAGLPAKHDHDPGEMAPAVWGWVPDLGQKARLWDPRRCCRTNSDRYARSPTKRKKELARLEAWLRRFLSRRRYYAEPRTAALIVSRSARVRIGACVC